MLSIDSKKGLNCGKNFKIFLSKQSFYAKFILEIESQPLMKKGRSPKYG